MPDLSDPVFVRLVRRCTRSCALRCFSRQSKVNKDLADHDRVDDEADDSSLAFEAEQDIVEEDQLEERPAMKS